MERTLKAIAGSQIKVTRGSGRVLAMSLTRQIGLPVLSQTFTYLELVDMGMCQFGQALHQGVKSHSIMINEVVERLVRQSQGTGNADNTQNLTDYIWMSTHQGVDAGSDGIWDELIPDFEQLNLFINNASDVLVSREIAYAVSGLLTHCLSYASSSRYNERRSMELLRLGWRIGVAWEGILAGDIGSISQYVSLEEASRPTD